MEYDNKVMLEDLSLTYFAPNVFVTVKRFVLDNRRLESY